MARALDALDVFDLSVLATGRRTWHLRKKIMDGSTDASDANDGKSPNTAKLTLDTATVGLDAALSSGDAVIVGPGSFTGADWTRKDIHIRGSGINNTIITSPVISSGIVEDLSLGEVSYLMYSTGASLGLDLLMNRVSHADPTDGGTKLYLLLSETLGTPDGNYVARFNSCNFLNGVWLEDSDRFFFNDCFFGTGIAGGGDKSCVAGSIHGSAIFDNCQFRYYYTSKAVTFNGTTDVCTSNSHGLENGWKIIFTGGTLPTGLTAGTVYYVRDKDSNTFKVASSSGGSAIDFTGNGSGTIKFYIAEPVYGFSLGRGNFTLSNCIIDVRGEHYAGMDMVGLNLIPSSGASIDVILDNVLIYVPSGYKQIVSDNRATITITGNTNITRDNIDAGGANVKFSANYSAKVIGS